MQRFIGPLLKGALIGSVLVCVASAAAEPAGGVKDRDWQVAQAPGAKGPPGKGGAAAQTVPQGAADARLKQRVEQLEEQLVDMQVVVGTLESMARSGAGASSSPSISGGSQGYGGADSARLNGLETQVRALAAEIEQLTGQLRALAGQPRRAGAIDPAQNATTPPQGTTQFGSTTVTAGTDDAIGGLIAGEVQPAGPPASQAVATVPPEFQMPAAGPANGGNPQKLYETAHGYLMQRDYGAAEVAFEDFLKRYPDNSLSGNAQYWLGEAHFVRGEYKAAAGAFLKGYRDYASNSSAPDSLLKLAMSLDRLGHKDDACSTYAELPKRFPNAPQNVKRRAESERQRVGCR